MNLAYKDYSIEYDGTYGHRLIKPIGKKGSVPKPLRGSYSDVKEAKKAIDTHAPKLKGVKDVKAGNDSGS